MYELEIVVVVYDQIRDVSTRPLAIPFVVTVDHLKNPFRLDF